MTRMPIYVFENTVPRVIALANERGAAEFLPRFGSWHRAAGQGADGVTGLPEFLCTAIDARGYVLLHMDHAAAYPASAMSVPFTPRANDV